jgi:Protein of unknown function (DUF3617)
VITVVRWFPAASLAVLLASAVDAQAPALDVRTGLWEIASTATTAGSPPGIDVSKMTPEQKARMEAAMKARQGPHLAKTCITKEKLAKSPFLTQDESDANCTTTLTTNTRAALDGTKTCTGDRAMTVHIHVDALSPTSIKGTFKISRDGQGRNMTTDFAMDGKWLAAACGDVK